MNLYYNPREQFQLFDPLSLRGAGGSGLAPVDHPKVKEDSDLFRIMICGHSSTLVINVPKYLSHFYNLFLDSGKSFFSYGLLRRVLRQIGEENRDIVVLNVKDRHCPFKSISWDQLATLHSTAILVEDIVSCSKKQFEQLAFSLAVKCHHFATNPQILVTHQVTRTSTYLGKVFRMVVCDNNKF